MIELWAVGAEQCEGVAKSVVRLREQGDRVKKVEFFIKAKSVIVVSERGECFIISCEKGLEEKIQIEMESPTMVHTFQSRGEKLIAIG